MSGDYWNRWPIPLTFTEPGDKVEGVIVAFGDMRDKYPQIHVRTADGKVRVVNITQARLHEQLGELAPGEGDRIRITYAGEAPKAAPGMNPTKEFTVELKRAAGPRPPENGAERKREVRSENAPPGVGA